MVAISISRGGEISTLLQYFACESNGHMPGKCSRQLFEQDSVSIWLTSILLLLLGLMPALNLLFLVNFKTVKEKIKSAMHGPTILSHSNRERNGHPLQNLTSDELQKSASELLETIAN